MMTHNSPQLLAGLSVENLILEQRQFLVVTFILLLFGLKIPNQRRQIPNLKETQIKS